MSTETPSVIYLVSDGTCRTCDQVVKAVLVQFDREEVRIVRKANVRRPATVANLMQQAEEEGGLVFYTLVGDKARETIQQEARQRMVPVVDLLGPVLVSLYDLFASTPRVRPGILHQSNKEQTDRIDAVEYTLQHDDGVRAHELTEADVVLVAVSRCSKSTTCFYLGYSGIRAANVPLFADCEPPAGLLEVDPRRVIGLTVNPHRLRAVREARLSSWGMSLTDDYAERMQVARELRAANEQMAKYGWVSIDVSYKAIEEIAREVRQKLQEAGIDVGVRESGD